MQPAGLGVVVWLPAGACDTRIAREALAFGLAPAPLSTWFCPTCGVQRPGLLLGVATTCEDQLAAACERLHRLIQMHS